MLDQQCLPRETLKEYLAGWSAPEQSDWIESHLSQCDQCEQTIASLESDPDSLVGLVQECNTQRGRSTNSSDNTDAPVAAALQAARSFMMDPEPKPTGKAEPWEPPTTDLGAYELLRPLGRGGMGSVYLARHRKLGKEVAVKLLPAHNFRSDFFTARFEREVRASGGLEHPAIVQATDAGEFEGTQYLVMEHVDGLDLSRTSRLTGRLTIADACEVARQVALGLSYAHSKGIIHRDIKPSNLMLSRAGETKILDFGLARVGPWEGVSAELTTVGQLMGTLDYMAPEQAERPDAVDYRADLYSLGATLFRLLCGRAPLAAAPDLSPLAKLRLLATHEPPRLDTLREDAPVALVELVASLLARDPANRPASADHVAEQLLQFSGNHQLAELSRSALLSNEQTPADQLPPSQMAALPNARTLADNQPKKPRKWLLAAALLPLLILAGVWITLETQKGQLVIESESEASVRLLKNGKVYNEVKVEPGVNSTRIYAGKYEIKLATGSDSLSLSEEQITIARGKTQIASITLASEKKPVSPTAPTATNQTPNLAYTNEPVYLGKPLSFYLTSLARERSGKGLGDAFEAINALLGPETEEIISDAVLEILPRIDGDLRVFQGEGERASSSEVDYEGFQLLQRANPRNTYVELVVNELNKAEPRWRERILSHGVFYTSAPSNLTPLVHWMDKNILQPESDAELRFMAGTVCVRWRYFSYSLSEEDKTSLDQLFDNNPSFDGAFWRTQIDYVDEDTQLDSEQLIARIKPPCLSAWKNNTSPSALIEASIQLSFMIDQKLLNDQETKSLRSDVSQYLNDFKVDKNSILQFVQVDAHFPKLGHLPPELLRTRSSTGGFRGSSSRTISLRIDGKENSKTILISKVAFLADKLKIGANDTYQEILDITAEDYLRVRGLISRIPMSLELSWPGLKLDTRILDSTFGRLGNSSSWSDLKSLTADEWKSYLLHYQIEKYIPREEEKWVLEQLMGSGGAMGGDITNGGSGFGSATPAGNAKGSASEKPNKNNENAREGRRSESRNSRDQNSNNILPSRGESPQNPKQDPATDSEEELFEGRTLSEWLRILPLEKSDSGIVKSIEAISALVSEGTQDAIASTLEQKLPLMDWNSPAHFQAAFQLFRSAEKERYWNFVLEHLATDDNKQLRSMLLLHAIEPTHEFAEIQPVHEWLVENLIHDENSDPTQIAAAYREILNSPKCSESLQEPLYTALHQCERLPLSFWYEERAKSSTWAKAAIDHVTSVWTNPESSKQEYCLAAILLKYNYRMTIPSERRGFPPASLKALFDVNTISQTLDDRLQRLLESEEAWNNTIELPNDLPVGPGYASYKGRLLNVWRPQGSRTNLDHSQGAFVYEMEALLCMLDYGSQNLPGQIALDKLKPSMEAVRTSQIPTIAKLWRELGENGKIDFQEDYRNLISQFESHWEKAGIRRPIDEEALALAKINRAQVDACSIYALMCDALGLSEVLAARPILDRVKRHMADAQFKDFDADNDGSLNQTERDSFYPQLIVWLRSDYCHPEMIEVELDADQDGAVSIEEVHQYYDAGLDARRKTEVEEDSPSTTYLRYAKTTFLKYDKNNDGLLSKSESRAMLKKVDGADVNADGFISIAEYADFRRRNYANGWQRN
ncbi:MAG: protein kinase [Planctomycetota bacterium]